LPYSKPEDAGVVVGAGQFAQRRQIQSPLRREAEDKDGAQRVKEKESQE
jgi:hypothetical protein